MNKKQNTTLLDATKLTPEEAAHCKENNVLTVADAEKTFGFQKKCRDEDEARHAKTGVWVSEPCWTCKTIATKLGFPV